MTFRCRAGPFQLGLTCSHAVCATLNATWRSRTDGFDCFGYVLSHQIIFAKYYLASHACGPYGPDAHTGGQASQQGIARCCVIASVLASARKGLCRTESAFLLDYMILITLEYRFPCPEAGPSLPTRPDHLQTPRILTHQSRREYNHRTS